MAIPKFTEAHRTKEKTEIFWNGIFRGIVKKTNTGGFEYTRSDSRLSVFGFGDEDRAITVLLETWGIK